MKVLQLTVHFSPNIGGVETHLLDLVDALIKRGWEVVVLSYQPLVAKTRWQLYEKIDRFEIIRIPWIQGLFYKLVTQPILEFLYLLPGLFLTTPLILLWKNPSVIHAHGLVAGFVGVFWGKIFGKKIIISTHSIYSFPKKGLYRNFAAFIFKNADYVLGLSKQAAEEIVSLGISESKVENFTYWVDLQKFRKVPNAKNKLGWKEEFICLFVGRLIAEKGIELLLESIKNWDKHISLKIIGSGPLDTKVREVSSKHLNVDFIDGVDRDNLPIYYSGADILIIPSISEEGFGRVILESLACQTPVIGSKRGAIPEAMDDTVGKLIDVSAENIRQTVNYFYTHKKILSGLAKNCRKFAERRFSEKNAEKIIKSYKE